MVKAVGRYKTEYKWLAENPVQVKAIAIVNKQPKVICTWEGSLDKV